jgi:hypothetical protein
MCSNVGSRNSGWDFTREINREEGERVIPRMLEHILPLCKFNNTGLKKLLINLLRAQTNAVVRGEETVGPTAPWGSATKIANVSYCTRLCTSCYSLELTMPSICGCL